MQDTSIPVTVQAPGITVRPLKDTVSDTTQTHVALVQDTLHSDSTVKKGFFRKFYNYFKTANVDKTLTKKFDFSIIGGPHYSGDIKLGLGIVAAGLYRVDRKDLSIPPSNVSLFGDITTTGFWMLGIRGNTLFKSGKFRLDLLTNKRYIGENHFKDIVMPDSIPAIVDKDLFEEVQLKIKKNSRAPARHKAEDDYLLTTKLFCGMCGAMMFGECGTGRNKVVHHYYKCATAKRFKTCKKKTVRKEWLEDLVIAETMKLIQDDAVIDAIVAEVMELQDQENTTLPLLEKQMREVENGIENMLNAIQAGVLTNSTKSRLEKLEAQQKELEVRIAEEKIARPRLSENQVRFWLTRFRKLDPNVKSHRKMLINTFVNAVYLYDEKVLIAFNYKDGTKTITFDEIAAPNVPEGNGSDLGCFAP